MFQRFRLSVFLLGKRFVRSFIDSISVSAFLMRERFLCLRQRAAAAKFPFGGGCSLWGYT